MVERSNGVGQVRNHHRISRQVQIGTEFFRLLLVPSGCSIQVEHGSIVNLYSLHGEHVSPQLQLPTVRPQEVFERKLSLPNRESGLLCHVLVAVVEEHADQPGRKHLAEEDGVVLANKEDVFLLELAGRLLWVLLGGEGSPIHEFTGRVDRLVPVLGFKRDVFDRH